MARHNNISRHTQDYANQILVNKTRLTRGLQSINTLQDILDNLGETALKSYQLPISTTQIPGIVRSATQAETDAGAVDNLYVSPRMLRNAVTKPEATESVKGIARYQTDSDQMNEQQSRTIINPKNLHHVLNTRRATEGKSGTLTIATRQQAEAGVDDASAMTPAKVKQAIARFTPRVEFATASESVQGYTRLANAQQTSQGTLNIGYAVQPKSFVSARASTTSVGTTKLATNEQALAGTATDLAVTPANLKALITTTASNNRAGLVKLTTDVNSRDSGVALSPLANVVPQSRTVNGQPLTNNIHINASDVNAYSKQESDQRYLGQGVPSGTVIAFAGSNAPNGYLLCHGQSLNKNSYRSLFNAIGYTYGGSGDNFNLPDLRGEFIRGFDAGRGADRNRTFGSWQKATVNVSNGSDYEGSHSHGLAIGPNLQGEGRYEWERPGERCKYGIYHCRNHPPRWIGPENRAKEMTAYECAELIGGDVIRNQDVQGLYHQWSNGGGNGNAVGTIPNERQIQSGHLAYGVRPRNIAMNYIIKA